MSIVQQYKKFQENLNGFADTITFQEFRSKIQPLRGKKEWDAADDDYVAGLHRAGAGHALQALYGQGHPAAARVLGAGPIPPDPCGRPELQRWAVGFVQGARKKGWTADAFRRALTCLLTAADGFPGDPVFEALRYKYSGGSSPAYREVIANALMFATLSGEEQLQSIAQSLQPADE